MKSNTSPPGPAAPKLRLANERARPRWWGLLWRVPLFLVFLGGFVALYASGGAYVYFSRNLPKIPKKLGSSGMRVPSQIFSGDDRLIADFPHQDEGRRLPLKYHMIPNLLVKAFVAAEDAEFFDHDGISVKGIVRAAYENLRAGRIVQGGSTITQQVAKTFLTRERKFKRKAREAILARHLEAHFSKEQILEYYLNNILLGHGASGVQAAAQNYFGKNVYELNLAEISVLAALPRCPSQCNPVVNPERSRRQQTTVLDRMLARGHISAEMRQKALDTPLKILPRKDYLRDVSPYFAERVRRTIERKYGDRVLFEEGWRIYATVDLELQDLGRKAVERGIKGLDRKQGYRGAHTRLPKSRWPEFLERSRKYYGASLKEGLRPGRVYLALVTSVSGSTARVKIADFESTIRLEDMRWAHKPDLVRFTNRGRVRSVAQVLRSGDVIDVKLHQPSGREKKQWKRKLAKKRRQWALAQRRAARRARRSKVATAGKPEPYKAPDAPVHVDLFQDPAVRAALYSIEPDSGYINSMVGGYDFETDRLNRAYQSCRPPGSVFKGIYYSAALEKGYTIATPILDVPRNEYDPVRKSNWKPANYDGEFRGEVALKTALVASMNNPSIRVFEFVGIEGALRWARLMGIKTRIAADKSSALGSSCVKLSQITSAYSVYSLYGKKPRPVYIKRIVDRHGHLVEDFTAYYDPFLDAWSKPDRLVQRLYDTKTRILDQANAWLMTQMLFGVANYGTGYKAKRAGRPVAGKTGTTNNSYDAWFVGYSSDVTTGVWIGHDRNDRALGVYETGGHTALPIWVDYMRASLRKRPQSKFWRPWNIVYRAGVPYKRGTERSEYAKPEAARIDEGSEYMRAEF